MSVPKFTGYSTIACSAQLARARRMSQTEHDVLSTDNALISAVGLQKMVRSVLDPPCGCAISENGCVDVSLCTQYHTHIPVPVISRWCDQTTALLVNCGALVFWSGWARPSVLSIIGRAPTVAQTRSMLQRSYKATSHIKYKFVVHKRYDELLQSDVLDISASHHIGEKGSILLQTLNQTTRFGNLILRNNG